jgi:hypothetical protein
MLFESVDIIRYVAAILNTWSFDHHQLSKAMELRNTHLRIRQEISNKKWNGEPVVVVDVDDVIADFRTRFYEWLESRGVKTDLEGKEYYNTDAIVRAGIDPNTVFEDFISQGGMMELQPVQWLLDEIQALKDSGHWIQILTARPQENPMCEYATYAWLESWGVDVDAIGFSPEKYRWLTQQEYFLKGKVKFALDDSPKHALEYSTHGIRVLAPLKTYNEQLIDVKNIDVYRNQEEFSKAINNLEVK